MLMQILTHTPQWVFVLFAGLVYLGIRQMMPRRVGQHRATVLPLVMTALSMAGVVSAFGNAPQALISWAAGTVLVCALSLRFSSGRTVSYDAASRSFEMPGSVVPMALYMGIFFTKYAVGINMGMQPALAHSANFAMLVGGVYGAFSGIFLSRAARLWRMAQTQTPAAAAQATTA